MLVSTVSTGKPERGTKNTTTKLKSGGLGWLGKEEYFSYPDEVQVVWLDSKSHQIDSGKPCV